MGKLRSRRGAEIVAERDPREGQIVDSNRITRVSRFSERSSHFYEHPRRPAFQILQKLGAATLISALVILAASPADAAFTAGNLAVFAADNASANNTTFTILELNAATANQGSPVNSIPINGASGPEALRTSGSASSTGYLADSNDGTLLAFTGHNSTSSSGNINTVTARGVGTLDSAGTFLLGTTYTGTSGNQTRGATTLDRSTWFIGDQGGFYSNGSSLPSPSGNIRGVKSFGGVVYALSASSSLAPVGTISAASGGTYLALPGLGTGASSRQDFYLVSSAGNNTFDILYILDATSATVGTIFKYSLLDGSWVANGSSGTSFGGFGLCAVKSGDGSRLYVTTGTGSTAGNRVVQLIDTAGFNSAISINSADNVTLYTAAAGTTMKGIAFAPIPVATAPVVEASAASDFGVSTATLNGNILSDGGATVSERGFVYKTDPGASLDDNKTAVPGTTGAYSLTLSSLNVNKHYYFKAYAINTAGTTLSSPERDFWTLANTPGGPFVGTSPTPTTLDIAFGSDGNPEATTYAIQETGSGHFVQANGSLGTSAVYQTASAWGSLVVTGLNPNTLYTFRVQAKNGAQVATEFGPSASGTTTVATSPTITVLPASLTFPPTIVNGTSANQTYTAAGQNLIDDIVINAPANFEISTSSASGFGNSVTLAQSGGLVPSTIIYVRFTPALQAGYSGNISHVSSGAIDASVAVSGMGALPPSVSTQPASALTVAGATLNGTVTGTNGAAITDRGFFWKTSPGITTSDNQVPEGGTSESSFSSELSALSANTIYYYRAYAVNAIGVALDGSETSFYTLAKTPTAPTVNTPTTSSLRIAIGTGDGNPAGTTYAIQETGNGKYVQADGSLDVTPVYETSEAWGAKTVTGLNLGTVYGFKVKAANGAAIDTAFGPSTIAATANNPFTPGNLALYRVGDGSGVLNSAASPVFVDELTTSGAFVQSVPLPSTGVSAFANSGSANSEGALMLSPDGQVLCFAGYNAVTGTPSVASSAAARAVGTLDGTAHVSLATTSTSQYTGNNFRSAATDGANNFWGAGQTSGTYYFGLASPAGEIQSVAPNTRVINIFNGSIYFSSSSGAYKGISVIPGLPTESSTPTLFISETNSAYGFSLNPAGTIAYVADDTASASGGIQRYDYAGGAWSLTYTLGSGSPNIGARGLAVDWSDSTPVIYGTSAESSANRLIMITDTGSDSTAVTLATASANTIFRGVAFAPKNAQSILFTRGTTVTRTFGGAAFSDEAIASSGLGVNYSSDNPSVATIDADGTVTITGAGTAHILADQSGNKFYGAARQASQTLIVLKADPTVTAWPAASEIACGQSLAASTLIGGSATPAGTFDFTTPSIVPNTGTAPQEVTYTPFDTANYNAIAGTVSVTVSAGTAGGTASPALSAVCGGSGTTILLSGYMGTVLKWQLSTDGTSSWSDIASTDSSLNTGGLLQTTWFRAVVEGELCGMATSTVAIVSIEAAPAITIDLTNQIVCAGSRVTWVVVATGGGLAYQWQRDGTNLVEGAGNFTGTTNSTLTNSAIALEDGLPEAHGYMCIASGTCAPVTNSSRVSLEVSPVAVGGTAHAVLSNLCSGNGTTIELTGQTGVVVKWQASTDGGISWSDITSTDTLLNTGDLTQTTEFRAVVQSGVCAMATSSVATVTISEPPVLITDVTNQTVCAGIQVTWSIAATGSDLIYQWQRDGTNLVEGAGNFTGTTNSTLTNSAIALEDALPEAQGYVCIVSGTCAPVTNSSRVSLEVSPGAVGGTAHAVLSNLCSGNGTTIELTGQTGAVVKWQASIDGGISWSNISSTDTLLNTGHLTQTTEFRAVVQNGVCAMATSSVATVTISEPPVLITDVTNQTVCAGIQVTWSIAATGGDLIYQWQRDGTNLVEGAGNFTGTTNSTLTNSAIALEDALVEAQGYVCMVSGACAPVTNSSRVSLEVSPVSVGGIAHAVLSNLCSGNGTTIELSGQTGAVVKWQASTDGGVNWSDIASTDTVLNTGDLTQTTEFRAVVQSGVCAAATSSVAIVVVDSLSAGGTATPTLPAVCMGSGTTVELSGQIGAIVKWQVSTDGGVNWSDIASTDSFLNTGDLTQRTQFRAVVQNGVCAAISSVATVTIVEPPAITIDLTNQTVCIGSEVTWSVAVTGSGLSYQWQRDGTNLVEGVGNFIGTTNSTLTNTAIVLEDGLSEGQGYACIVSGTCALVTQSSRVSLGVNLESVGGTANPALLNVCSAGGTTIALTGQTGPVEKWQASSDGGSSWSDIASEETFLNTGDLTQTTQFRAVVHNLPCAEAISSVATVIVNPPSAGGAAVAAQTAVCSGNRTTIELSGQVGAVVKWQRSTDAGNSWSDILSTDTSLDTGDLTQVTQFRAIVQSGACAAATSSVATISLNPASVGGTARPNASLVCTGIATSIELTGHSGIILKWQSSTNDGSSWSDIASTDNPLNTGALTQGTHFRAVVQNGLCAAVNSSAAIVDVDTVSAGASFTAIACRGGSSTVTISASGGTAPYSGTGQFSAPAGAHSYTVSDANGCSATVGVNIPESITPLLVVSAGVDKEIYAGSSTIIGGNPTASGGAPGYTYLWSPALGLNNPTLANCTASPEVTTHYTVTVSDTNGCTSNATVTVIVGAAPPHEPLGPSSRTTPLAFSEIMYKPAPRGDSSNVEFIELYNSNPWFEDIGGYRIVGDSMNYTLPAGTILPGGAFLVIAASPSSMQTVYGITNVLGPYVGSLKKSGTLQLLDEQGSVLLSVPYSNVYPWPVAATGTGHSIILANPSYGEGDPRAWAISDSVGGSPGRIDTFHPSPLRDVVINELLAHSEDSGVQQFVELYNHSTNRNDLSGCRLADDSGTNQFVIPENTSIEPGGFVSFDATQLGFALNEEGGTIYFIKPDGSGILDAIQFEAQADGVSFGRWPDGASMIHPLASRTPGTNNSNILIADIVINELMYHPISGNDDDQYIELFNKGTNPADLSNWKFNAGITFTFPPGTTLAANSYLVIARNLTNLLAKYPNLNQNNTLGNYSGKLSHNGERVELVRPQTITRTNGSGSIITNTTYVLEDEVTYSTGGRWGQWADGGGSSLELINPRANHQLAANWGDSDETQKSSWVTVENTGVLDNGLNYELTIAHVQMGLLDVGECLVDEIEVRAGIDGPNLVTNPGFETGLGGWSLLGDHSRSTLESPGYSSSSALHIRSSDQIWTGINSCQGALNANSLAAGQTATLRFKARWLRGWPEALLRLNGNWLEATARLSVPQNLGTPGAPNSVRLANPGPAIYEVHHSPAIPAANQAVVVTARADDPDGVQSLALNYRLDPNSSYTTVTMKDDGTDGDAISGDGVFSATIPGQSSNTLVAFYVSSADAQGGTSRFPALLNDNAPPRECLARFGDENSQGSFGSYHLWITQTNLTRWTQLGFLANEPHDCTIVNGPRVIYNAQGQYQGSPAKQDSANTPDGLLCNYKLTFPEDDKLLGATSFNALHQPGNGPGDDPSLQREQAANALLRKLGVPWQYRRFVAVYFNGNRRGPLMEDSQRPGAYFVKEHFPNDPDGWLYKMNSWFEFSPEPDSQNDLDYLNAGSTLMPFTTTGGVKKTARYRWNFLIRRTPDSASNFTNVFSLVDAANSYGTPGYVANMETVADMENWMRTFAVNHAVGNFDSFGAVSAQNMYGYVGLQTKYTLLNYDLNIVLGNPVSWNPGEHLFDVYSQDPNMANIYREPTFRRMYLRALKELVNGSLDPANSGPLLDAKYQAFLANGLNVEDPNTGIKPWMIAAKTSIASQIAAEDTTNFTAQLSIDVSNDVATIGGLAPVDVKTILFNGVEWPITWTTVTNWMARVVLQPGTNQFSVAGADRQGHTLPGDVDTVSIVYNQVAPPLVGGVVINEIMYHPGLAGAEYVELYNPSSSVTFDLSGCQLPGLSYTFPQGSLMGPRSFLVLAANRQVFATAYGATIPVFATFQGVLSTMDGTLALVNTAGQVITQVHYQNRPPWPPSADGTWASLQLIDPLQDNWRAGNWRAIDPYQNPQWSYATATGTSSSSTLYIYPLAAGDFFIDDIKLVSGSVPEIGANVLADGDFETGYPGPWGVSPILASSALSTTIKHSGNASLHIVASDGGETRSSAIYQDIIPALPADQPYTLSFWYLQSANPTTGGLVARLSGSGIATSVNPSPPEREFAIFTPGTTNSIADQLPAFPPLWINELQAENLTGITNLAGQHAAWLEIYNPTTNTVSLNGLWLANNYTNLTQWPFPDDAIIHAGEFKVIFADGLTNLSTENEMHASFTIPGGSGSLALSRLYKGQAQVLDFVDYTNLPANYSYGSFPNGQSFDRRSFFSTTPGDFNVVMNPPPLSFIPYNNAGLVYAQNFDALPNPGMQSVNSGNPVTINGITYSLANPFGFAAPAIANGNLGGLAITELAGWYGMADPAASVGTRFGATDGDQTTGGVISFGLPNSSNRTLGLLATSTTGFTAFGAKFLNGTGKTLTRMTLQVTGEVWRQSNLPKTLQFSYLIDPSGQEGFSTNYTARIARMNVSFPTVAGAVGGVAVDGTSPGNQTNLGVVNYPINWLPDAALWVAWEMMDPAGKSQGLGIDNFSFSASDQPMAAPVSLTVSQDASNLTFSWPTLVDQFYQLEFTGDLNTSWIPLGGPIEGTGKPVEFNYQIASSNGFFRLRLILP